MFDIAWAQSGPAPSGPSLIVNLIPLVLVFLIFYFLLIRPQQRKLKQHREMLERLKRNDEVMTSGGIYGKVVALAEQIVTLEIAPNVRIRVNRNQIAAVVKPEKAPPAKEIKEP